MGRSERTAVQGTFDFSARLADVGEDTEVGVDCHHADLVVPSEAWPELYEASHEGVSYYLNAST